MRSEGYSSCFVILNSTESSYMSIYSSSVIIIVYVIMYIIIIRGGQFTILRHDNS